MYRVVHMRPESSNAPSQNLNIYTKMPENLCAALLLTGTTFKSHRDMTPVCASVALYLATVRTRSPRRKRGGGGNGGKPNWQGLMPTKKPASSPAPSLDP